MELPKRGTSLAPMTTKVTDNDLVLSKRVRYESQFKEEGVLLRPTDFKQWRSKLDKLKQVVRVANPNELYIHKSQFTMDYRRANSVEKRNRKRQNSAIKTKVVNIQGAQDQVLMDIRQESVIDTALNS